MVLIEPDYKALIHLNSELNQIQDLDFLLERILLEARKVVHAEAGSIYVCEKGGEEDENPGEKLVIKYSQNDVLQEKLPPGRKLIYSVFSVPINEKTLSGYCGLIKNIVNVPDAYNIPPDAPFSYSYSYDEISGYKTVSILTVPLLTADERLLGVLQIINSKNEGGNTVPFSENDEFIIKYFAVQAAEVLQRAYLIRTMILRMIKMAELRDPKETGAHVNRVAGYAVEIYDRWAYKHNIPEGERNRFRDDFKIASMLHDVGKVAISDMILKKPARFTPDEFLIMQHHTVYGAGLFADPQGAVDLLALDVALTHHENWDGSGYPGWIDPVTGVFLKTGEDGKALGKKGEEIPLTGRIVALADVFDALSSRRVYKDAWNEEQVLVEIRSLSGIKFDPELVDIFFDILPHIRQIRALNPEIVD
jgi:HD-GYP domain-containing protein (c-di-GMP phosphodiesterase class II)